MFDFWFGGITAFGGMSVGIELSEESLSHAVHLAFLCECRGGKPRTCTHYEITDAGLCLYSYISDAADNVPSKFPSPYTADDAVAFIRQWLESVAKDEDSEEFRRFAGPEPDTDGSTSHTAFILGTSLQDTLQKDQEDQNVRLSDNLVLIVRPAWMVYGK